MERACVAAVPAWMMPWWPATGRTGRSSGRPRTDSHAGEVRSRRSRKSARSAAERTGPILGAVRIARRLVLSRRPRRRSGPPDPSGPASAGTPTSRASRSLGRLGRGVPPTAKSRDGRVARRAVGLVVAPSRSPSSGSTALTQMRPATLAPVDQRISPSDQRGLRSGGRSEGSAHPGPASTSASRPPWRRCLAWPDRAVADLDEGIWPIRRCDPAVASGAARADAPAPVDRGVGIDVAGCRVAAGRPTLEWHQDAGAPRAWSQAAKAPGVAGGLKVTVTAAPSGILANRRSGRRSSCGTSTTTRDSPRSSARLAGGRPDRRRRCPTSLHSWHGPFAGRLISRLPSSTASRSAGVDLAHTSSWRPTG